LKPATQKAIDIKGAAMGAGEVKWVRPNMKIFSKTYKMKAVDWLNMSRGAGLALFDGHMGEDMDCRGSGGGMGGNSNPFPHVLLCYMQRGWKTADYTTDKTV
jgi:hypothetical protein